MMETGIRVASATYLAAYDRRFAYVMLREWTPRRLLDELRAGRFQQELDPEQVAELDACLVAWVQRALGMLTLRDALMVDARRGRRVFTLICAALTRERLLVPDGLAAALPREGALLSLPEPLRASDPIADLARRARADELALCVLGDGADYPFPDDLEALTPALPTGSQPLAMAAFEQPTGWRRRFSALLATAGVALLGMPMLLGQIPDHPAGLPLALLTLALLVGIRAGWPGWAGSLCIWLVPNLPGFRHGTPLDSLWPAFPLLAVGLLLLSADRRVRAMWGWLWSANI